MSIRNKDGKTKLFSQPQSSSYSTDLDWFLRCFIIKAINCAGVNDAIRKCLDEFITRNLWYNHSKTKQYKTILYIVTTDSIYVVT